MESSSSSSPPPSLESKLFSDNALPQKNLIKKINKTIKMIRKNNTESDIENKHVLSRAVLKNTIPSILLEIEILEKQINLKKEILLKEETYLKDLEDLFLSKDKITIISNKNEKILCDFRENMIEIELEKKTSQLLLEKISKYDEEKN